MDNPPAFPGTAKRMEKGFNTDKLYEVTIEYPGMSLRDWYAGLALQGFLAAGDQQRRFDELVSNEWKISDAKTKTEDDIVDSCFEFADVMLKKREKK